MGNWSLPKLGYLIGVPIMNKECNILGSILGSSYFAKLPFLNLPKGTSGCKKGFWGVPLRTTWGLVKRGRTHKPLSPNPKQ